MNQMQGKRVVVMGLGRFGGGVGVTRFLVQQGADVLVTDLLGEAELANSLNQLDGLPVRYRLGGHDPSDFASADLVVVNPAVDQRKNPFIQAALQNNVPLTTEVKLLIDQLDRSRIVGITGTAGKSTTTAMIGHILCHALGPDQVHVGGNLGGSLLSELDRIGSQDWIVLELSSFMLEMLPDFSPHIAVVTNLSDNHLDRHGTLDAYAAAKQAILRHQQPGDRAILGQSVADWAALTPAEARIVEAPSPTLDAQRVPLQLAIPGQHNRLNAAMAVAACEGVGVAPEQATLALASFTGLPHRLQLVADRHGVRFFNDSKSTTPEAAVLAINSFPRGKVHAILGGYDKHADLSPMAHRAARRCAAIYTIGATGDTIAEEAESVADHCPVHRCRELKQAVQQAISQARSGDIVLLSPGCASWDQFENYEQRGHLFADLAQADPVSESR